MSTPAEVPRDASDSVSRLGPTSLHQESSASVPAVIVPRTRTRSPELKRRRSCIHPQRDARVRYPGCECGRVLSHGVFVIDLERALEHTVRVGGPGAAPAPGFALRPHRPPIAALARHAIHRGKRANFRCASVESTHSPNLVRSPSRDLVFRKSLEEVRPPCPSRARRESNNWAGIWRESDRQSQEESRFWRPTFVFLWRCEAE